MSDTQEQARDRTQATDQKRARDAGGHRAARARGVVARSLTRTTTPARLLTVLLLAMAVLVSGLGALYQRAHRAHLTEQARTAGPKVAGKHASEILSYDYRTLDRDLARAKADTTGRLRREYEQLTNRLVAPKAKENQVVVRANVVGASAIEASPERVVTLLFVNQSTESKLLDGPRIDQNRVKMTLKKVDGKWLAAQIVAL